MGSGFNLHSTRKLRKIYVNKLPGDSDCIHFEFVGEGYGDGCTYLQEVLVFTDHCNKMLAALKEQIDKLYNEHCMEEAYADGLLESDQQRQGEN